MRGKSKRFEIFMFLLPALLVYTIFMFVPLIASLPISLFEWSGLGGKTFAGLANYQKLFSVQPFNDRLWNALSNNVIWFLATMVFQNVIGLTLALIVSKNIYFKRFFRTIFFMPTTLSVILVGFIFTLLLNPQFGIINKIFNSINLSDIAFFPWLGNQKTALLCIAIVNSWQYIGIPIVIFLAAIEGISNDIMEAARIDGCDDRKTFRHITFPLMLPTIGMVTILTFVGDFSGFELVYGMEGTQAGPNYATDILGTFFYRTAFGSYGGSAQDMGLGAAIAAFMFVVISVGVIGWIIYDRKVDNYL